MAKIRHVAMLSRDPERLARFYTQVLGLEEVSRSSGGIFVNDGYINLALLYTANNGNAHTGVNHMGFLVENAAEMKQKLLSQEGDLKVEYQSVPFETPYAEIKFRDPDGFVFDISERGWATGDETKGAKIRHVAQMTKDPGKLARFYTQVLGLEEVYRGGNNVVYLSDGYLNVALIVVRGNVAPGPNHIGFKVENGEEMRRKLLALEGDFKVVPDELPTFVSQLYVEEKYRDPEGFLFDISQTGWATTKVTEAATA